MTQAQFDQWSAAEQAMDSQSANPLGRAMARVMNFVGNTLLESGKFALRKGQLFVYVVKRTTMILLAGPGGGKEAFGREEAKYLIECGRWRSLRPPTVEGKGHDSWWMRLHDLYQTNYDRAFFHARENLDNTLAVPPPLISWRSRPDILALIKIHNKSPPADDSAYFEDACIVCQRAWFTHSEAACQLKCDHYMCLECFTSHVDSSSGRGTLGPKDPDTLGKYISCFMCKTLTPITIDRTVVTAPDELPWWRWNIMMRRMEKETKDNWLLRLQTLPHDMPPWHAEIPDDWDQERQANEIKVYVRYDEVVKFMELPKEIWALLPYGFSLDNPTVSPEALVLETTLKQELKRLSIGKSKTFNTKQMVDHFQAVGLKAIQPVVVQNPVARLGNPVFPPGFRAYQNFLCEWTARGCFMCPMGQMDVMGFWERMKNEKGAWWKDEKDVWGFP